MHDRTIILFVLVLLGAACHVARAFPGAMVPLVRTSEDDRWLDQVPEGVTLAVRATGLSTHRSPAIDRAALDFVRTLPEFASLREAWGELSETLGLDPAETFDRLLGREMALYVSEGTWTITTALDASTERRIRARLRPAVRDRIESYPVLSIARGAVEIVTIPQQDHVLAIVAPAASRDLIARTLHARHEQARNARFRTVAFPEFSRNVDRDERAARIVLVRTGAPVFAEVRTSRNEVEIRALFSRDEPLPVLRRPLDAQALLRLDALARTPSCVAAVAMRSDALDRLGPRAPRPRLGGIEDGVLQRLAAGWASWSGPLVVACAELPQPGADPIAGLAFACWTDTVERHWIDPFSAWIASSADVLYWPRGLGPRPDLPMAEKAGLRTALVPDRRPHPHGLPNANANHPHATPGGRLVSWGIEPVAVGDQGWWFGSIQPASACDAGASPVQTPAMAQWTLERLARPLAWSTPVLAADSGIAARGFVDVPRFVARFAAPDPSLSILTHVARVAWEVRDQGADGLLVHVSVALAEPPAR